MDKGTIGILEGIGYVASFLVVGGSLVEIPVLATVGVTVLGIVLVRLAGVAARNAEPAGTVQRPMEPKEQGEAAGGSEA